MITKSNTRTNNNSVTPDQANYRGHVVFNRTAGQHKANTLRRYFSTGRGGSQPGYKHEEARTDQGQEI